MCFENYLYETYQIEQDKKMRSLTQPCFVSSGDVLINPQAKSFQWQNWIDGQEKKQKKNPFEYFDQQKWKYGLIDWPKLFKESGMVISSKEGKVSVKCPWIENHTKNEQKGAGFRVAPVGQRVGAAPDREMHAEADRANDHGDNRGQLDHGIAEHVLPLGRLGARGGRRGEALAGQLVEGARLGVPLDLVRLGGREALALDRQRVEEDRAGQAAELLELRRQGDHVVPVDMYLPGCPPRPEMLIDAILKLHDQVQTTKFGANRAAQIEELENAALKALPTSEMKGLLR